MDRQHDGINVGTDTVFGIPFGDPQKFHGVPQVCRILDIDSFQLVDALHVDILQADAHIEGDGGEDCDFAGRVQSFYIRRGIRLGVPQCLGFLQGFGIGQLGFFHAREHIVRRSVDDAHDTRNAVGRQAVFQGHDDGDAAADGSFELEIDALLPRQAQKLFAVFRNEVLVGRDDIFAMRQGRFNVFLRRMDASHEFHDDLDVRIFHDVFNPIRHG